MEGTEPHGKESLKSEKKEERKGNRIRDDSCTDCQTETEQTPTDGDVPAKEQKGHAGKSQGEVGMSQATPDSIKQGSVTSAPATPRGALVGAAPGAESLPTPAPAAGLRIGSFADASFDNWKVGPRYTVFKILGHGSYGQVAEAVDNHTKERVAIKCISGVFDQDIDTKRIVRELYILRHLKHTNVIKLLNVLSPQLPNGEPRHEFNEIYLVFEFVDTDLHKLINSPQYLTIDHVRAFLYQILCALKYIHSSQVIHRDIKPANILLNEDCGLKICDFGLARVVRAEVKAPEGAGPEASANVGNVLKRSASPGGGSSCSKLTTGGEAEPAQKRQRSSSGSSAGMMNGPSPDGNETERSATPGGSAESVLPSSGSSTSSAASLRGDNDTGSESSPKKLVRSLTKHVITRWYRPPELILLQEYTNAVDMWSVGCIFAELLGMQKGSIGSFKERSPLFPGKSCFPLSAESDRTYKDRLDQLNVIFNVIGTPSAEDIATLGEVRHYLRGLPPMQRKDFARTYKAAPPEAIDLLNKMLVFDPRKRVTVEQCLEHKFLSSIRSKRSETVAEPELFASITAEHELSRAELREALLNELAHFQSASAASSPSKSATSPGE